MATEKDEEYEARREERRESRRGAGGDPVGVTFRLNYCEQSLRNHNDELAAQRLMLQQLSEAVQKLATDKEQTGDRLNQVFGLVDQRFTEAQAGSQAIRELTHERFESMTATVTSVAHEVVTRLEVINREIESLRRTPQPPTPQQAAAPPPPH